MKRWKLFWSPEGKQITTVTALTARKAIRKAPQPYRKYLGEIYAEEEHQCVYGPVEHARLTGNPHRKCTVDGCKNITLDLED